MNLLHAIVLGIVQGLTEFLPISSSAHLLVVPDALGWGDPGAAFTAVIQMGTMAAVLTYFWRDIISVFGGWVRGISSGGSRDTYEWRMGWIVIFGTIPISVFGLVFKDTIEGAARSLTLVAATLIVGGIVLELCDRFGRDDRHVTDARVRDGWLIGLAQACALVPGVSRSGATISAARLLRFERADAARVSFLLSIPAVVLSGLFEFKHAFGSSIDALPVLVATVVSFVVGYASIAVLLRFLTSHRVTVFVGYRIVLGVAIIAVLVTR